MSHVESTTATLDEPHGHGHHPPYLAHHFESMQQQNDAGKLAMWVFLATEILMFGGLFCAYAVWRANHYEAFWIGHTYLNTWWGAVNTLILIASSFTMAWGVRACQLNNQKLCVILLFLTFLGGVGFMAIKYVEYSTKFSHGMGPGIWYNPHLHDEAADEAAHADHDSSHEAGGGSMVERKGGSGLRDHGTAHHTAEELAIARPFFSIYFALTGLHGLHVLVGMALVGWAMIRAYNGAFNAEYSAPVDIVGLYWHLVDLIWIFLFPLLYLI
jgi:cytochrome c oxidase subunit III